MDVISPHSNKSDPNRNEADKIQLQFRIAATAAVVLLGSGAVFYHLVEQFSWVDAFYFSAVSLTTVGYGDIVPISDIGKIFTIFYLLIGIGVIAFFANVLVKNAMLKRERRHLKKQK